MLILEKHAYGAYSATAIDRNGFYLLNRFFGKTMLQAYQASSSAAQDIHFLDYLQESLRTRRTRKENLHKALRENPANFAGKIP